MGAQATVKMLAAYIQAALPTMFLTGFFQSPAQNYHNSAEVELDIERSGEDVAIAIIDPSTGARINSDDLYTNKRFKPPIFDEGFALNAFDLQKRQIGQDPYTDPDFQAAAIAQAFKAFRKLEAKVRRAIELMAAQVLQTGTLTLVDKDGNVLYTLDFKPKASHFPTAATAWSAGGSKIDDLMQLASVIRTDGLVRPNTLIMNGEGAFMEFIRDEEVQKLMDNRAINIGGIAPQTAGEGATYQGEVRIGNYMFSIFTYDAMYTDPQTRVKTPYVGTDKVIMLDRNNSRLDLSFGAIPTLAPPDARVLRYMPSRIPNENGRMDLSTNGWITPDGRQLMVSAGTRPLTIPTAIDSYGCLTTEA